jgi:hypothetical protein
MDKAMANQSEKVDFSNMTRKELFDWMHGQLRSGKMTFDESHAFLFLSSGNGFDDIQHDFIQKARGVIQFELEHNNQSMLKKYEAALQMMQKVMSETE